MAESFPDFFPDGVVRSLAEVLARPMCKVGDIPECILAYWVSCFRKTVLMIDYPGWSASDH